MLVVFCIPVLMAVLKPPAHGQTETGSIYGSVIDPTGAVVSDATVRLIDIDRNIHRETGTDSSGFYTFASVHPGHYQMEVEKNGFKAVRLTGVTLNVQGNLEHSFKLDIGPASETITVTANTANVNTTDGALSTVVDRTFAENIPLNGRTFQTLITLTPGVVLTQTTFDNQGQFSVNGQRADANYFTVDGASASFGATGYGTLAQIAGGALPALSVSGGTNSLVSVDAMQEFRVQTSSFAPEYGRTPGGQVSIATRFGTNDFHGTLFEYFRNSILDANDWFADFNHLAKPAERQNDFGGVFGGPLVKDKTFFFFSYEGLRLRLPSTEETVVPDTPSRQEAQSMNLGILPYLNAYSVANGTDLGSGLAQFNSTFTNPSTLNAYSIRVDEALSSKISLFGRYNYSPSSLDQRGPFPAPYTVLSVRELADSSIHTFTLGLDQMVTSRISNQARANYSNQRIETKFVSDHFGGAVPPSDSTLFPSAYSTANSLFELFIVGAGEFARGKQATVEQRQINLIDNVSVVSGRHQLKFGVDYRWLSPFSSLYGYLQFAEFTGVTTCVVQPCTETPGDALSGTAYAAFLQATQSNALLSHNFSVYGQDTWKPSPRLSLTYGLRWDINPPLKGKNLANEPFTVTGLNNPSTIALAPRGTPLYDTTYGNLAPRIGIAYQLGGNTDWNSVVRGGFGIFYDLGSGSLGGVSGYFPYQAVKSLFLVPFPLSAASSAPPTLSTSPPVSTILVADPHLNLPRTYEWNATLEQEIGRNQLVSLTYVGSAGRDLLRTYNLLNPNPNFGFVTVTDNSATSDYHALQAKFERRLAQGFQILASYTWSHSIDIASTDTFNYLGAPGFITNPNNDRGNSDFDIRHSFTAGLTYNLPTVPRNDIGRVILSGWSVDSFIFGRTAPPVNLTAGYSFADGAAFKLRPNQVPGMPLELFGSQYPGGKIFNKSAFSTPQQGQQGDFGRNVLRGFGAVQADFAIQREFRLNEKVQVRFRGEFFNIFNHPNFGSPIGDLTSSQFGYSTETLASSLGSSGSLNGGLNPLYQIGGPRSIQLALKLQF